MATSTNPQSKPINQKRGPTVGNVATGSKRDTFVKEKASTGSERSKIADMITGALERRGTGMKPFIDPTVEGLHADTGPKSNPTANGSKLPGKYKAPKK
jgi:hypothetical protein|tara:strand:- start:3949 stop:4245 length:297 start_codon:yes stop_codon:yes gene_type:complete